MLPKTLLSLLILILIVQLVSLRPQLLSFSNHSIGELSLVTKDVKSFTKRMYTEATLSSVQEVTDYDGVVFVGDVMLGRHVETLMRQEGAEYPYSGVALHEFSSQPAVVANFESAIAPVHTQTAANTMRFSVDKAYLQSFGKYVTHASLANNHSLDYGEEGYLNAVSLLEKESVSVFGHNTRIDAESISYLNTTRGRIALIGVNATQRIPEEFEITSVCNKAKRQSDFQVMYIHWGDEYQSTHSDTQRVLAEVMVDECADLIIGHHPHVVQDIDLIKGVTVFYSLGNYIFDQYFSDDVKNGLVVSLQFDEVPGLLLFPVSSSETKSVPKPIEREGRQKFLNDLAARSHPSLKIAIEFGKINLFEPVATSTKMAIMWR